MSVSAIIMVCRYDIVQHGVSVCVCVCDCTCVCAYTCMRVRIVCVYMSGLSCVMHFFFQYACRLSREYNYT